MGFKSAVTLLAVGIALAGGCSNVNRRLNPASVTLEHRKTNQTRSAVFAEVIAPQEQTAPPVRSDRVVTAPTRVMPLPRDNDGVFVGLALSGGGSRSANFAAACMFQLQRVGLLQHVDYLSSVSGGSVTAAYYCLNQGEWNPQDVQKKLTQPFANDLLLRSLLPWNTAAFLFTDWDRSDVLAHVFEDRLFSRGGRPLTFADLRRDRPRLLINATDLQSGRRFVFCNETFDELNSNLAAYPVAYAVTASAAVPVILHPVTLRDFSTSFKQYRHLIDGGVADNLGVPTLVETYSAQLRSAAESGQPDPYPRGAVFVVLDARTHFNAALSDKSDMGLIDSLEAAVGLASTDLVNRTSSATMAEIIVNSAPDNQPASELRRQIHEINDEGFVRFKDRAGHPVRVIYMTLSQVNGLPNLPFAEFSDSLNGIGTYFNISTTEAYHLYEAAELLMKYKFETRVSEVVAEIEGRTTP